MEEKARTWSLACPPISRWASTGLRLHPAAATLPAVYASPCYRAGLPHCPRLSLSRPHGWWGRPHALFLGLASGVHRHDSQLVGAGCSAVTAGYSGDSSSAQLAGLALLVLPNAGRLAGSPLPRSPRRARGLCHFHLQPPGGLCIFECVCRIRTSDPQLIKLLL